MNIWTYSRLKFVQVYPNFVDKVKVLQLKGCDKLTASSI